VLNKSFESLLETYMARRIVIVALIVVAVTTATVALIVPHYNYSVMYQFWTRAFNTVVH